MHGLLKAVFSMPQIMAVKQFVGQVGLFCYAFFCIKLAIGFIQSVRIIGNIMQFYLLPFGE